MRMVDAILTVLLLTGIVADSTAQPRTSQWYVGGGVGVSWPSRMEQEGHNFDTTCYPNENCVSPAGPTPVGYRWRYNIEGQAGPAYEFFIGRMLSLLRAEFSMIQQKNDLSSEFSGISYGDGSPIASIESAIESGSRASVGDLVIRSLAVNVYYDVPMASNRVIPYVGTGLGIAFVEVTDLFYESSYDGPDGPYDPPLSFYNSRTNENLFDTIFTKHLYAGIDFGLREKTLLGVKLSHTWMRDFVATGGYEIHPIPGLTSETRFGDMRRWSVGLTLKLLLGR